MSGIVATLSAVSSVGSALETLSFGGAGPVVLGGLCFQDFEVPASISLPVKQAVAVHRLIGGMRVLSAMGPDYGDIVWTGTMMGAFAEVRAQTLKSLGDAEQAVVLTWGTWAFTVIPSFVALHERYQRIDYSIRCTVIRDESSTPISASHDLNNSVTQDLAAAAQGGVALSGALGTVQSTIAAVGPLLPGSNRVAATLTALAGAQGIANASAATAATTLRAMGARAAPIGLPVAGMSDLGNAATATGVLAQTSMANGYLGRAAANLAANR